MNDECPICVPPEKCSGYPHLWKRLREAPELWRDIHDQVNGLAPRSIPPAAPPDPWRPIIRACEHHNPACCATPMPFCSLYLKDVMREDCIACLQNRGIEP